MSCRGGEVLDDRIAGMSPLGGVQLASREPQLVDHADEGTRSHGGPDAQDSHADHPTSGLGDDERRGGDIEEVAQEVGVLVPCSRIDVGGSHKADGGVEIGRSGAADVNLHEGPHGGIWACDSQRALLDDPQQDTTITRDELRGRPGSIGSHARCASIAPRHRAPL